MINERGLYGKYVVRKIESRSSLSGLGTLGRPLTDVFVLSPEKDPTALAALIHYAALTPNVELAADLQTWIELIQGDSDGS